jgi:hypothetical protein
LMLLPYTTPGYLVDDLNLRTAVIEFDLLPIFGIHLLHRPG